MDLTTIPQSLRRRTASETHPFVCALCGATSDDEHSCCEQCGATLVVGVDESAVYETIYPMCDPDCRVNRQPSSRRSRVRRILVSSVDEFPPARAVRRRLQWGVKTLRNRLLRWRPV